MKFLIFSSEAFMPRTKVCLDSIKRFHPESQIHLATIDTKALPGQYMKGFSKFSIAALISLVERTDEAVIKMGADCVLYDRLPKFLAPFYSIALTPHVVDPPPSELHAKFHHHGWVNADFMVATKASLPLLRWLYQQEMTKDHSRGLFFEQTFLSAAPCLFEGVHIIRDKTINAAYWNLHERQITFDEGFAVNGENLTMFHFSGYEIGKPHRMSRYYDGPDATGDLLALFQGYDARVREHGGI